MGVHSLTVVVPNIHNSASILAPGGPDGPKVQYFSWTLAHATPL